MGVTLFQNPNQGIKKVILLCLRTPRRKHWNRLGAFSRGRVNKPENMRVHLVSKSLFNKNRRIQVIVVLLISTQKRNFTLESSRGFSRWVREERSVTTILGLNWKTWTSSLEILNRIIKHSKNSHRTQRTPRINILFPKRPLPQWVHRRQFHSRDHNR
jgi:hypothetical protein